MQISELSLDSSMFNVSSLLGTNGSQDLLRSINQRSGAGSFFGSMYDPLREQFNCYMTQVVEPIRRVGEKIEGLADQIFHRDRFRAIDSIAELKKGIPPCMYPGIVYYEPIRNMLNDERIDGFGIDPSTMLPYDPYKNVCASGRASSDDMDENGCYTIHISMSSDDPDLSPEEIMDLKLTRDFIDVFMADDKTKHLDFTDYPSLHG